LFCDNLYTQTLGGVKTFTGTVYVPTPATDVSRTEVVTAAWILTKGYAPIDSPTFTGTPWAPTPVSDASRTQLVTAKWVNDKNYANTNYVYSYGFFNSAIYAYMTYPANGNNIIIKDSNGNNIYFNYGIYMCCMRSSQVLRKCQTVEFVRLTGDGPDDQGSYLGGPFSNGGITNLHFRPEQVQGTHYITVTGSTNAVEYLDLRIYCLL